MLNREIRYFLMAVIERLLILFHSFILLIFSGGRESFLLDTGDG